MKVTYFAFYGRAEPLRMLLNHAKAEFEDERIDFKDWPALKEKLGGGGLPRLTVDGKVYAQGQAILRYLGNTHGYYPKDDALAALKCDQVIDNLVDAMKGSGVTNHILALSKPEEPSEEIEAVYAKAGEMIVAMVEKQLAHGGKFMTGNDITIADFAIFGSTSVYTHNKGQNPACAKLYEAVNKSLKASEKFSAWSDAMAEELSAHLESRPPVPL